MAEKIQIVQMRLPEKDKLLAFLREAYAENPRMSDERFWNWHFLENPYVSSDDLPVWIAKSGDRIAGQLAAIPVELKVGSEQKQAMWILDLIVHEDFRRRGIAKRLVQKSEEFCSLGLGVNTMEQHAPMLLQSLGWKIVGKIPRFAKLLFPGNVLPKVSRIDLLRRSINWVYAPFRPKVREVENIRAIDHFDSQFDELWREADGQFQCAVARDSQLLDWLYFKQPGKKFDILGYFEGERLLGYVVLFVRKPHSNGGVTKAAITDLVYHPANTKKIVNGLLRGAVNIAVNRGAGSLVTDVVDSFVAERLDDFGFSRVKNPLQLMVKSSEHRDLLLNAENWFLTRGDSDISIFEQPNF